MRVKRFSFHIFLKKSRGKSFTPAACPQGYFIDITSRALYAFAMYSKNQQVTPDSTVGSAIDAFLALHGLAPPNHPRMHFHEAMHIAANLPSIDLKSEWLVSIYEEVFCRGPFYIHNHKDEPLHGDPLPIPDFDKVFHAADMRVALINTKYKPVDTSDRETAMRAYDHAVELESRFRQAANGRAFYQHSAAELRSLPTAYLT